jgi:programmed cell death protein 5
MSSESDLDEIRRRRVLELRRQITEEQAKVQEQEKNESRKQGVLRQILTMEARQRLHRIKLVKPEFAAQLELQLIQVAQSGRVKLPLNDEQLKGLLVQLLPSKRETRFRRI